MNGGGKHPETKQLHITQPVVEERLEFRPRQDSASGALGRVTLSQRHIWPPKSLTVDPVVS